MLFFGLFNALANSFGDFFCFPKAVTDTAFPVADNNQRAKAETPTTFDHLGHAADMDNLIQ